MKFEGAFIVIALLIIYSEARVLKDVIKQIKENVNTGKQDQNFDKHHNHGGDLDKYLQHLERGNNKNENIPWEESNIDTNDPDNSIENVFDIDVRFNGNKEQEAISNKKPGGKIAFSEIEDGHIHGALKKIQEMTENVVHHVKENVDGIRDTIFGMLNENGKGKSTFSDHKKNKNLFDRPTIPLQQEKHDHNGMRKPTLYEKVDKTNEREIYNFPKFHTRNHSKRREKTESINENSEDIKEVKSIHDSSKENNHLEHSLKHRPHEEIREIDDATHSNSDINEVVTVEEDQDVNNTENKEE